MFTAHFKTAIVIVGERVVTPNIYSQIECVRL